jgi:nitrous oxidase accessory protein
MVATGVTFPARPELAVNAPAPATSLPCPPAGQVIPAGAALQPLLDTAPEGSVLCLSAGVYQGPITIRTPLRLQGPSDAVIASPGRDTTVRVLAAHVELDGFTVDGSGTRFDVNDAAVNVHGDDVLVRGLTVRRALFGIVAERSTGVRIERNRVIGDPETAEGLRGDGIKLWEVRGSTVLNNRLDDSRDLLIWYSPGNVVAENTVVRSRYGAHFMYSSDCIVQKNRYQGNVVGVFIMYSRNIAVRDNVITDNTSQDGMGLGVKDSGDIEVERNRFVRDRQCLYFDNSPFGESERMLVRANTLALCNTGVTFHRSETRTTFADNRFESNDSPAAVEGHGTAQGVTWRGNYFDDYRGYDANHDGVGDVPYELRDLSERLIARRPSLAFFRGTVALDVIDLAARAFPLLQPETLLVDSAPRMSPPADVR